MAILCSTSIRCGSPIDDALRAIRELGFSDIDLLAIDGWAHVHPSELAASWEETTGRLHRLLAENGLVPLAFNTGTGPQLHDRSDSANQQRREQIAALIRLMDAYGVKIAAIQPRDRDRNRPWPDVLADCVATLREYDAAAREAGVVFALELHVGSPFETLDQARRLLESMPEARLVYDPSHFVMQGIDIRETEWLMERAVLVHLRDAAPGRMQTHFGAGGVDFDWMLAALARRGYSGHFSIEYLEAPDMDTREDVIAARNAVARYFPESARSLPQSQQRR